MPKLTVVIPTFNRPDYLEQAMRSVLSQTYPSFSLRVSDNASDLDIRSVVEKLDDHRIAFVRRPENVGSSMNINLSVEESETPFVLVLPDDDLLEPTHLERAIGALERWPSAGAVHTACWVDSDGTRTGHDFLSTSLPVLESPDRFRYRCMTDSWIACFPATLFRRKAFLESGGLDPADYPFDDFSLFLRMSERWGLGYVPERLAITRAHPDTSSWRLGQVVEGRYRTDPRVPVMIEQRRRAFLARSQVAEPERVRLARRADASLRRDLVWLLAERMDEGEDRLTLARSLGNLVRNDRMHLLDAATWRLSARLVLPRRVSAWLKTLK